jgi:hypothetical protein
MAKASDLRSKLGASGVSPMAPKKDIFAVNHAGDAGLPNAEHSHGKPGESGRSNTQANKAAKPLGGGGGASSRPKV